MQRFKLIPSVTATTEVAVLQVPTNWQDSQELRVLAASWLSQYSDNNVSLNDPLGEEGYFWREERYLDGTVAIKIFQNVTSSASIQDLTEDFE